MKSQRLEDLSDTHSIIQCPHCQTKFAIELANIAHLDSPRFHCSRCDHVFSLDSRNASGKVAPSTPPSAPPSNAIEQIDTREADLAKERALASSAFDAVPRGFSLSSSAAAPQPIQSQFEPQASAGPRAPTGQMRFDFPDPQAGSQVAANAALARAPINTPAHNFEKQNQATFAAAALTPSPARSGLSRWASFALMAAPLLFFLSAMVGASAYLNQDPSQADSFLMSISSGEPQVAPAELIVSKAQFRRVALDSGETAYLVSGTITNTTERDLRDIKIEGVAFDTSGAIVARTQVDAAATLVKTRVRALSMQMIRDLQSGQIKNKRDLKIGQSEDFLFALTDGKPESARFFSVRVYSVHQ